MPNIHSTPPVLSHAPDIVTLPKKFAAALQVTQYWHRGLHRDPARQWLRQLVREIARSL